MRACRFTWAPTQLLCAFAATGRFNQPNRLLPTRLSTYSRARLALDLLSLCLLTLQPSFRPSWALSPCCSDSFAVRVHPFDAGGVSRGDYTFARTETAPLRLSRSLQETQSVEVRSLAWSFADTDSSREWADLLASPLLAAFPRPPDCLLTAPAPLLAPLCATHISTTPSHLLSDPTHALQIAIAAPQPFHLEDNAAPHRRPAFSPLRLALGQLWAHVRLPSAPASAHASLGLLAPTASFLTRSVLVCCPCCPKALDRVCSATFVVRPSSLTLV